MTLYVDSYNMVHQYVKLYATFKLDHSHVKFSIQPDGLAPSG
jgi:hypothetical protein